MSPGSSPLTEQHPAACQVRSPFDEEPGCPATPPPVTHTAMYHAFG